MKQMESLKDERPQILKNKDKRLKKRKEGEGRLADEDVDERQVVRAEEQAARSARMLYVLQRQVCEIEDELNKKKRGIKHTKKSQTLSRLAAAHRGAVRALQTFVSQAPLQPKVGHGLPPMYQELSALIRQLSLLAAQLHINGEDFSGEAKREKDRDEKVQFHSKDEPGKEEVVSRAIDKTPEKASAFIQEVADRKPRRTIKPRSPPKQVVTSSPDPTPERDAVLQAGLSALLRVKDTPVQTPVVKPKFQPRPAVQVEKPVKQASKKSLLLPVKLKLQRQKAFQTAKRVKLHHDVDQAHFAKGTVASILKKAPPVVGHQPVAQTRTPPRAPTWEGPHTPERVHYQGLHSLSPRSHRRQYETQKLQSPRSPKYARRILPTDLELIEREVARQRWLDEEAERKIRDLERERRLEVMQRHRRSPDVLLPKRLISETEDAIRSRLKPLLDRAEAIAETEAKREAGQKKSLQHQLGKLASQTTLNQADVLAEKVLDDILEDTVLEMQRLELEDDVQRQADNLQNSSTLENILQRLQSFEKAEEEIRQHWVQVNYADVEKSTENLPTGKRTQPAKDPKPIMFTRAVETESHRLLPGNAQAPPDDDRRGVSEPFRLLNEISATSSFSSLMEERSFAQSSIYKSSQNSSAPQSRPLTSGTRPTVFLSVPKEMRASIVSYRNRFNKYLQDTSTHEEGTFDPWGLLNRISEELLEEALQEVGHELDNVCDVYAEALYNQEFVSVSSDA